MTLSFHLSDEFIAGYENRPVPWGYADAAGNSLGEITFLRTYSRKKPCEHGNVGDECPCPKAKERWYEVCRRVIEGMFTLQKDHARTNRLPWSDVKAQRSAEDAFERLFTFKWTPPGRGLWMMGTPLVMEQRNSAALQNCAFVSTEDMTKTDPSGPFAFLMEASMLGIGVGFDTKGADKHFHVHAPKAVPSGEFVLDDTGRALAPQILTEDGLVDPGELGAEVHVITDDREGWVASVVRLIDAYLKPGQTLPVWDYTQVRPAGEPIRTFGGTAAGPGPLRKLHEALRRVLDAKAGQTLTSTDILDIGNLIGVCVVSGNVRRSAELALGSVDDAAFLNAKNPEVFPERNSYDPEAPGWGWMSNNSVKVSLGDDLSGIVEGIKLNGEPGVVWMDVSRDYGRLIDPPNGKDHRAAGYNPCVTGDTLVATADGRGAVPIGQLAREDVPYPVHTVDANGVIGIGTAVKTWKTRENAAIVKVLLDDGSSVRATSDHLFMLEDGSYKSAGELSPGEGLKPHGAALARRTVVAVTDCGVEDVYDLTVPGTHNFAVITDAAAGTGVFVHNCAEQTLESYECCVSGDTLIQTREGLRAIEDVLGKDIEVWNGQEWSAVTPFFTGRNSLYRVTLSDGSHLDVTPGHEWSARRPTERTFKKLPTRELEVGMVLPEFELGATAGEHNDHAYTWGWVAGDGYIDQRQVMAIVQGDEASILPVLGGRPYIPQAHLSGKHHQRVNVTDIVPMDAAVAMRREDRLPDEVFGWDAESIAAFFGGWIDTDGSVIHQEATDHYVLYGSEGKLRQAQILLRRIGVNHATLRIFGHAGDKTSVGRRNTDLYRLLIPSYESAAIATVLKRAEKVGSRHGANNAHPDGEPIDRARKQKIVSIDLIADDADTFCFTEPKRGMGVFGNALTYQCTLVETFLGRHDDLEDFKRTLKVAYLYAKTVTLIPTHWQRTNAIMQRNRRIGTSMSGVANFADNRGINVLRAWMDAGYETVTYYDRVYSEWLCVRESIKTTTVKPSGTVSILAGESPGVHWAPGGEFFERRIRFSSADPMVTLFRQAGYLVEPASESPDTTVVVAFPIHSSAKRSEKQVTLFEKAHLAATAQRHWSDNSVSVTLSFDTESEADHIGTVLAMYEGSLKTVSFLPTGRMTFPQMPYTEIEPAVYEQGRMTLFPVDLSPIYDGLGVDAVGEAFCSTDSCEVKTIANTAEAAEAEADLAVEVTV